MFQTVSRCRIFAYFLGLVSIERPHILPCSCHPQSLIGPFLCKSELRGIAAACHTASEAFLHRLYWHCAARLDHGLRQPVRRLAAARPTCRVDQPLTPSIPRLGRPAWRLPGGRTHAVCLCETRQGRSAQSSIRRRSDPNTDHCWRHSGRPDRRSDTGFYPPVGSEAGFAELTCMLEDFVLHYFIEQLKPVEPIPVSTASFARHRCPQRSTCSSRPLRSRVSRPSGTLGSSLPMPH
jgi:hypothetical protein